MNRRHDANHERQSAANRGCELLVRLRLLSDRIGECRRFARHCHSAVIALSLEELADRLEAEAALMAAKLDLFARIETPLS